MENLRPIEEIYSIDKARWVGSGFRVRNYFPEGRDLLNRFTPFALMDYNAPFEFKPSGSPRDIGAHPHRGIETVTFAFQGSVEHHDNAGNHGIIYPGDVQWMTAGKAIMHKEYHEEEFQKNGGFMEMVQLWISLPKKDRLTEPRYQDITNDDMGIYQTSCKKGTVTIVAGEFQGVKGPAKTFSPMNVYIVDLEDEGSITLNEPGDYNTGMLILSGNMEVNNSPAKDKDFVLFENDEGKIEINSKSPTKFLLLSGQPLNEPQAAAGPFVMNTKEELKQASQDYRDGLFGTERF